MPEASSHTLATAFVFTSGAEGFTPSCNPIVLGTERNPEYVSYTYNRRIADDRSFDWDAANLDHIAAIELARPTWRRLYRTKRSTLTTK